MITPLPCVLTINGGSSAFRFAISDTGVTPRRRLAGKNVKMVIACAGPG